VGEDIPALQRRMGVDVLAVPAGELNHDVLLVAVGAFASMALEVAKRLHNQGIGVTVVDPRGCCRYPTAFANWRCNHKLLVNAGRQRGQRRCGLGDSAALRRAEIDMPCRDVGLRQDFLRARLTR